MKLIKKYKIYWSPKFINEFKSILNFINNYSVSYNFKNNIIDLIYSLEFFPERYPKIANFKHKDRNIRKIVFKKFIIIYEVQVSVRQSLHSTYFLFKTKLFKSFIISRLFLLIFC